MREKIKERNKKLELYVNHYKDWRDKAIALKFLQEFGQEYNLSIENLPSIQRRVGEARERLKIGKPKGSNSEMLKALTEFLKENAQLQNKVVAIKFINEHGAKYNLSLQNALMLQRRLSDIRTQIGLPAPEKLKHKIKLDDVIVNKINILKEKERNKEAILLMLNKGKPLEINKLCKRINEDKEYVEYLLQEIKEEIYNVKEDKGKVFIEKIAPIGGSKIINLDKYKSKKYKFGLTADNHLNSKFERLDVLNALYDIFEKEGINIVFNGGNWIDGEARFNKYELINVGMTKQIDYFIKNYPQRKGIETQFIAGDDHEGWYWQREGVNIGEYMQMKAQMSGRYDLKYLGYVEADIILKAKNGQAILRLMHGGGGSAYALSYTPQKMIESFQGGMKPNILCLGHYHKADYMYYRDVHAIQMGTTQDQTTFMRKKKIQASLGGWIIEFEQADDGSIHRFKAEWITFFDKNYYERKQYYK